MRSDPVFILGMHRSGTSMLARMLQRAGLFIGAPVDPHYENPAIVTINEGLLRRAGAGWDEPEAFADSMAERDFFRSAVRHCADSWAHPDNQRAFWGEHASPPPEMPWGFKDPRLVFTLPCWLARYPKARLIFISRHGVDVARSLVKRHEAMIADFKRALPGVTVQPGLRFRSGLVEHGLRCLTPEGAFSLWESYMAQQARLFTRLQEGGVAMLSLPYEALVHRPHAMLEQVFGFAGLSAEDARCEDIAALAEASRAFAWRGDVEWLPFAQSHAAVLARYGYDA